MEVTFLGTGAAFSRDGAKAGYLLTNQDNRLLIDLGSGALRNLQRVADPLDVHAILFSHVVHPDHCSDLPLFLMYRKYAGKGDVRAKNQLILGGPPGTKTLVEGVRGLYKDLAELPCLVEVREYTETTLSLPGFKIRARRVEHAYEPCLAYRIEAGGKSVAYSGDSAPCDTLTSLAQEADLFICECGTQEGTPHHAHHMPSQAGKTASEAGAKKLVLTHYPADSKEAALTTATKRHYDGEVVVGKDRMTLKV